MASGTANGRAALSMAELVTMLKAAASRVGYPYVWGGSGPTTFDCSGLVQWSFARAGVIMPRVAADQARTGPAIPFSQAQAGDLLFYRTDPTAPDYISHVAIYLGKGLMIQAPQHGCERADRPGGARQRVRGRGPGVPGYRRPGRRLAGRLTASPPASRL